jgi:hypothetical protein
MNDISVSRDFRFVGTSLAALVFYITNLACSYAFLTPPLGSYLGGAIFSKRNLIMSALLQIVGCGLLSTIGDAMNIMPRKYVFEAILGSGCLFGQLLL